ncbi:MAG: hypothetical protein Q8Q28_17615 [Pseudomonadota bacterium]|nr:hypothetical protein [Pseudomonadota bacterium]
MKLPYRFTALFLAGLAVPALAADKAPDKAPAKVAPAMPSLSDMGHMLKNALSEEETRLLIEYMQDSVMAAFKDEEVTLPPDLAFKLEVMAQRLKKQSNFYLDNLLKQMEEDIKRSLKEKMEVPPPVPYTPSEMPLLPTYTAPATAPAAVYAPPPTNYNPAPWGYVPWFYIPQPTYQAPAYPQPEANKPK